MSIYSKVPMPKPNKSLFDLSYSKMGTGEVGQEIPVLCDEVVSGDVIKVTTDSLVKLMPLVRPLLTDLNISFNYFFIPYRLLDEKFEDLFTGGEDGSSNFNAIPKINPKYFKGVNGSGKDIDSESTSPAVATASGSTPAFAIGGLWDSLGYPVDIASTPGATWLTNSISASKSRMDAFYTSPVAYNVMAYYTLFNEWFRDENIDDYHYEFDIDTDSSTGTRFLTRVDKVFSNGSKYATNMPLFQSRWSKDYFVGALPFAQRGTAPAMPVSGFLPVGYYQGSDFAGTVATYRANGWTADGSNADSPLTDLNRFLKHDGINNKDVSVDSGNSVGNKSFMEAVPVNNQQAYVADLSGAQTFDINDLRLAFSIQKWQERNAISGGRFHEVLLSHFGTAPADDTLDRPLYLGGFYNPILINSVIQTSESGSTVQGNETGRGVSAYRNNGFRYHVKEPGLVMCLMALKPKAHYSGQGFPRQFLKNNRYDFFFPEFANIGEQEVLSMELVADGTIDTDTSILGFQGRYDEMRSKQNIQTGLMRGNSNYSKWSASRSFSSVPTLSTEFIEIPKNFLDDCKSVVGEPLFMYEVHHNIKALRPLPKYPIPGGL